jgi:hypothetical protein
LFSVLWNIAAVSHLQNYKAQNKHLQNKYLSGLKVQQRKGRILIQTFCNFFCTYLSGLLCLLFY